MEGAKLALSHSARISECGIRHVFVLSRPTVRSQPPVLTSLQGLLAPNFPLTSTIFDSDNICVSIESRESVVCVKSGAERQGVTNLGRRRERPNKGGGAEG